MPATLLLYLWIVFQPTIFFAYFLGPVLAIKFVHRTRLPEQTIRPQRNSLVRFAHYTVVIVSRFTSIPFRIGFLLEGSVIEKPYVRRTLPILEKQLLVTDLSIEIVIERVA